MHSGICEMGLLDLINRCWLCVNKAHWIIKFNIDGLLIFRSYISGFIHTLFTFFCVIVIWYWLMPPIFLMIIYIYVYGMQMIYVHHCKTKQSATQYVEGLVCQKQLPRTCICNYTPQILWDEITNACSRCLLLPGKLSYFMEHTAYICCIDHSWNIIPIFCLLAKCNLNCLFAFGYHFPLWVLHDSNVISYHHIASYFI